MGFHRVSDKTKEAAVAEVLAGESVSAVARRHRVSDTSVRAWVRRAEEREAEEVRGRRAQSPTVELSVVLTERGVSLVMRDVSRGGSPAGTVRHLAGAPLGPGGKVRAMPVSSFEVPLERLLYLALEARRTYESAGLRVVPSPVGR